MTGIDRSFYQMAQEIQSLGEKELYHRMRRSFEAVSAETQKSCAVSSTSFCIGRSIRPTEF